MKRNSAKILVILMLLFLVGCSPMPERETNVVLIRNWIFVTEFPEYGVVCFTYKGIDCHPLKVE